MSSTYIDFTTTSPTATSGRLDLSAAPEFHRRTDTLDQDKLDAAVEVLGYDFEDRVGLTASENPEAVREFARARLRPYVDNLGQLDAGVSVHFDGVAGRPPSGSSATATSATSTSSSAPWTPVGSSTHPPTGRSSRTPARPWPRSPSWTTWSGLPAKRWADRRPTATGRRRAGGSPPRHQPGRPHYPSGDEPAPRFQLRRSPPRRLSYSFYRRRARDAPTIPWWGHRPARPGHSGGPLHADFGIVRPATMRPGRINPWQPLHNRGKHMRKAQLSSVRVLAPVLGVMLATTLRVAPAAASGVLAAAATATTSATLAAATSANVCTGVAGCRRVAIVDVDGDRRSDQVGLFHRGPEGGDTLTVRVRTATGRTLSTTSTLTQWGPGSPWYGAAAIDGVRGAELVIGAAAGAHFEQFRVITYRGGKLVTLTTPQTSTGAPQRWGVDGSYSSNIGVFRQVSTSGVVTLTIKAAARNGAVHDLVTSVFRWKSGRWVKVAVTRNRHASDATVNSISGWHIHGIRNY